MATVEHNLVECHNTDEELISIKTQGVIIQYNTFRNAAGVLDTRHSMGSAYIGN